MSRTVTTALQNQYESTHKMLVTLVEVIPDQLWYAPYNEVPLWKQVFHVVYFIDFWFRIKYDGSDFKSMAFDDKIAPEIDKEVEDGLSISREEIIEYLEKIHAKISDIFNLLDDEDMAKPIIPGAEKYTYADVIVGQIRHVMYNIGYCNGCLREHGLPESDWYAYNEKND